MYWPGHKAQCSCSQYCHDAMTLAAAPGSPNDQAPSLATGCHPGVPAGHWEQLEPDTCQSEESWAELSCVRRWWCLGPGPDQARPTHPDTLIITPQCQQRREIITTQNLSQGFKGEGTAHHESLNRRHNYSVSGKNSPAPVPVTFH